MVQIRYMALAAFLIIMPVIDSIGILPLQVAFGDEEESTDNNRNISALHSPIAGWNETEDSSYHYFFPLYHYYSSKEEDLQITTFIPLLSLHYSGDFNDNMKANTVFSLPLLAAMGSVSNDQASLSGYFSPYLSAGSFDWSGPGGEISASSISLFPKLPMLGTIPSFHLYTGASAGDISGQYSYMDALYFNGLNIGVIKDRTAGIEDDYSLLSFWDFSLYRSYTDLEGAGFSPHLQEFNTNRIVRDLFAFDWDDPDTPPISPELMSRINEARSGMPIEHFGILDPIFVYERCGEDCSAVGIEPLFFYHNKEGFTVPLLFFSFGDDGLSFSIKHLFPVIHGSGDNTRYDFLANLGTVYSLEDYNALDIKFLFSWRQEQSKGYAWGFLPYFSENGWRKNFRNDIKFIQFPGHAISGWRQNGNSGFECLSPLLFSCSSSLTGENEKTSDLSLGPFGLLFNYESEESRCLEHDSLWSLLYSYESELIKEDKKHEARKRRFTLGPLGVLCDCEWIPDSWVDSRFLWIFGYESDNEKFEADILGITIGRFQK